ncbi:MAG: polysaccharide biosynthesis protein [Nitrospirota bacterium]
MKKRAFDLFFAFVGLALFAPFFLAIAILIKWKTGHPVFQTRKVFGQRFRLFHLYGFNTALDPKAGADPNQAKKETLWLDKVLARLHAERFPQLINVLKGDMSLIGPRPERPFDVAFFQKEFEVILKMQPGIIDLFSISLDDQPPPPIKARDGDPPSPFFLKKMKLAKDYVSHQTLSLDIKILITFIVNSVLSWPLGATTASQSIPAPRNTETLSVRDILTRYRTCTVFVLHTLVITASSYFAFLLRFDGQIPAASMNAFITTLPILLLFRLASLYFMGLHTALWRYVNMIDIIQIGIAGVSSSGLIWATRNLFSIAGYPTSVLITDAILFLGMIATLRCTKSIYKNLTFMTTSTRKVLIIGAGNAGAMIARDMIQNPSYNRQPVAFIDDDPRKQNVHVHRIPVLGDRSMLEAVVKQVGAEEIIIALPSATSVETKGILNQCKSLGLPIKTVPNLPAVLNGEVGMSDLHTLDIEDLIGRAEITIEKDEIEKAVRGKTVLVTGAGGSIGSELCRQIATFSPESLILYEQNENNLHHIMIDLKTKFPTVSIVSVLGDILNAKKVTEVFGYYRPKIVFHAAAYKHVPLMEENPADAVRNNILGTAKILLAALRHEAESFVLISTDKAVYPSSVMGATKRIAEMIVQYFAPRTKTRLVTVRFGNVLESNGSVVPLFRSQIKKGGPVTVTDPEVKRYFISIQEAVQLVLQSAVLGQGGEIFVLDMGEPYKILDLARTMIILSGLTPNIDIPIQFVGLRKGEKLTEVLFENGEVLQKTPHDKISVAKSGKITHNIPFFLERLASAVERSPTPDDIRALLLEVLPNGTTLQAPPARKIATLIR